MTVPNENNKNTYTCNGSQTVFPYTFGIFSDDEIQVILYTIADGTETVLTLTTHYTVSGAPGTGNVTALTAYSSDYKLILTMNLPYTQDIDPVENDPNRAEITEEAYDRTVKLCLQLKEQLDRAVLLDASQSTQIVFPVPSADDVIGWNAGGTALENKTGYEAAAAAAAASAAAAATSASNASSSESAAQTAETNAETAETNAETAETAAEAAQAAAEAAAAAAEAAAAAGLFANVVAKDFSDSPIVPLLTEEGWLFNVDTSGGNVVVNLSALSVYAEDMQFAFCKVTADGNTITVNRGGTDTINGSTSATITEQWVTTVFIGDSATGLWVKTVQASVVASTINGTFVNGDLAAGVLTVSHGLGLSAPYAINIQVFDNNGNKIIPDEITGANNSIAIDLTTYGALSGTWGYTYGATSTASLQTAWEVGQTITIADGVNQSVNITNNDVTNNPLTMYLLNTSTGSGLHIQQDGVLGAGDSALYVYSNAINVTSDLVTIHQDNADSDVNTVRILSDGSGTGLYLDQAGILGAGENALKIYSAAPQTNSSLLYIVNDHASSTVAAAYIQSDGLGTGLLFQCNGNGAHIRLTGDPTVASPNDGDLWYDGTSLNFNDGSDTTDLLGGGGVMTLVETIAVSNDASIDFTGLSPDTHYVIKARLTSGQTNPIGFYLNNQDVFTGCIDTIDYTGNSSLVTDANGDQIVSFANGTNANIYLEFTTYWLDDSAINLKGEFRQNDKTVIFYLTGNSSSDLSSFKITHVGGAYLTGTASIYSVSTS